MGLEPRMGLRERVWLCVAALTPYALDVAFTLRGQPLSYWEGDYARNSEPISVVSWLLGAGPVVFAGIAIVWGLLVAVTLCFWNSRLVVLVAFSVSVAHAEGAGFWLLRWGWGLWPSAVAEAVWL